MHVSQIRIELAIAYYIYMICLTYLLRVLYICAIETSPAILALIVCGLQFGYIMRINLTSMKKIILMHELLR